jgi:hypothetical protein
VCRNTLMLAAWLHLMHVIHMELAGSNLPSAAGVLQW